MSELLTRRLDALKAANAAATLTGIRRGIEKESLRVTPTGTLAKTPHPLSLGSALTHPHITTDYSEALLEFITPATTGITTPLEFLDRVHRYVYAELGNELLWVNSMPCQVSDDNDVPVAQYGSSNIGQMKHIYRLGLGYRYGRKMQTIAGIHYNFSWPTAFWELHQQQEANQQPLQDFISSRYFDLLRNFHRYSWLLVYLFGASPALCQSFLKNNDHQLLKRFDHSLFRPSATSLRMSDLGYQNNAQSSLHISYNDLDSYVRTLNHAIHTPEPTYEDIGVCVDGSYRQLNANILQIENEYYSSIRPKRTIRQGERPTQALQRSGVEYIEVRVLDLDPFEPVGINADTMRFIDMFASYCLLERSPMVESCDQIAAKQNVRQAVYNGRDANVKLCRHGRQTTLATWGMELLDQLEDIAALYDQAEGSDLYRHSLAVQRGKIQDPTLTSSARILNVMTSENIGFYEFARRQAVLHRDHFLSRPLSSDEHKLFADMARDSIAAQCSREAEPQQPFEQFLADYFRD
ncbi:MAG: glutamate--cysteine ligase [Gammaproteobacteria bacterium HGW-Gammaproteobacteria-14]|nr:MAG: glutamate--cysteine ligase [Gammaproteobacteria bacterium HGW-Gammaproteobacteria-14]